MDGRRDEHQHRTGKSRTIVARVRRRFVLRSDRSTIATHAPHRHPEEAACFWRPTKDLCVEFTADSAWRRGHVRRSGKELPRGRAIADSTIQ